MNLGPDFICIGAQKAGSSWLHWNLLMHPDTAMPPEKEVNFLYMKQPESWKKKYIGFLLKDYPTWFRCYKRFIRMLFRFEDKTSIKWYRRYLFSDVTIENYRKLFPKMANKLTGDISPSYVALTSDKIKLLADHLPNTKIIYLIRHPVERAWSAFKMDHPECFQNEMTDELWANELTLKGERVCEHSRYMRTIHAWEEHFPGRVKIWHYEQLCENPAKFFIEICHHLTITPTAFFARNKVNEMVFKGSEHSMPLIVRKYFTDMLKEEVNAMHLRFNNDYTKKWVADLSLT